MTPGGASPFLLREAVPAARRLLGEWNRIGYSENAGSLCRDAWHYRFPSAFHTPTLQCAAYSLGRLFLFRHPENPFHDSGPVLRAVRSAAAFTRTLQHRDGSFPEWYPSQRSFCATSYLTAYFSMILPELGDGWVEEHGKWLFRAGRWISRNLREESSNQMAAAACALHCLSRWEKGEEFEPGKTRATGMLLKRQHKEGWFPECGGADPGYQSLTLDFLVRIQSRTPSEELLTSIRRGMDFLAAIVLPDGTVSSLCARRGTNFLMPFAVVRMSGSCGAAALLRERISRGFSTGTLPTASTVDTRCCAHLFLPSLVDAAVQESNGAARGGAPRERPEHDATTGTARVLSSAGVISFSSRNLHVVLSASRGGSFQGILDAPSPISMYNAGYLIRTRGSIVLSAGPTEHVLTEGDKSANGAGFQIRTSGRGATLPSRLLRSPRLLRAAALLGGGIAGRVGVSSAWEEYLKREAFRDFEASPFHFERNVAIGDSGIHVEDRVINPLRLPVESIGTASLPIPSSQPSSQIFSGSDLGWTFPISRKDSIRLARILATEGEIIVALRIAREGSRWTSYRESGGVRLGGSGDFGTASGHPEEDEP